jgi:hypothetical protein
MNQILTRADGLEFAYCEVCGNYVPFVEEDGSLLCKYEYDEYPEFATVVG